MRVMKADCEIGETVKMDWSTTKAGFYGSLEAILESNVSSISKGHKD